MSTHILGAIEGLCHRIGVLHGGRLELLASSAQLEARFPGRSLEDVFLAITGEGGTGDAVARFLAWWRT
jgi:ABC-2 type transport system ATP-binding protein